MFVGITNTPRDYAWGSQGAISELLGWRPTVSIEAELWLGAHAGSPSRIVDPSQTDGATDLATWIAHNPEIALGDENATRLPFLLKILAASAPLSLQAHPNEVQASLGFDRENAAGVPLDAAHRNYKDPFPKPELIFAVSETFDALCGFRPVSEIRGVIARLLDLDATDAGQSSRELRRWSELAQSEESLGEMFAWLISRGPGVDALIERVIDLARANADEFPVVVLLADEYPGDPGIVISLLTHFVRLEQGEALYLPAGNIHAYLSGVGVELMTASDNVLRGGLTPKHVDVAELMSVLDFRPVAVPYLNPSAVESGMQVFDTADTGLVLTRVTAGGRCDLTSPAVVLCTAGSTSIAGRNSRRTLSRGEIVFVTPDEEWIEFEPGGVAFVAMAR